MARWPVVPLHQVMFLRSPDIEVQPDAEYTFAGVFSFGRGVFRGETRLGAEFSYRVLTRVRTDYFTYPKLMAWEGALGVIPPECDGCVVSPEYPVFELDLERMLPRYADIYFRRREIWPMLKAASPGTNVRRRRLHPSAFLELEIPLPSLTEQRQLVTKIDRVAALVDEARCLLREADDEALRLCRALLRGRLHEAPPLVPVGDLVQQRPTDVIVSPDEEYHFAGVYSFGRGVFAGERKKGTEFAYKELTRLRKGNFTYPKLMAWEGALGVVPPDCDGLVVSPEFPVFEVDQERVLPDVLDVYFRDPTIWPSLKGDSPGTNVRRRRLNPSTFLSLKIPLPSMADQRRLANVRALLSEAARVRGGTLYELDALVGCLLRHVFGDVGDPPAAADERTAA